MANIQYKGGYKYQLRKEYQHQLAYIRPAHDFISDYVELNTDGLLTVRKGYAWDGPSGPTFDTKNFMRGSLVHDCLYQIIRHKDGLPYSLRDTADREMILVCKQDGMWWLRRLWVYWGLRIGGGKAAREESEKKLCFAPDYD